MKLYKYTKKRELSFASFDLLRSSTTLDIQICTKSPRQKRERS